jgi:tRNA(fMet)-specific endonuclease VapC
VSVYLLDTNIWSAWFDTNHKFHGSVEAHINQLSPEKKLYISIITWGEIYYGHKMECPQGPSEIQRKYLEFIKSKSPKLLDIDMHVTEIYGDLRARLFEKFMDKTKKKVLRPEQLIEPVTSKELGIQENDLWIAAQAVNRNLILVANDKMNRIRSVAPELCIVEWISNE